MQANISASLVHNQQVAQDSESLALSVQAQAASLHSLQQQQQEHHETRCRLLAVPDFAHLFPPLTLACRSMRQKIILLVP